MFLDLQKADVDILLIKRIRVWTAMCIPIPPFSHSLISYSITRRFLELCFQSN
ncbi:hypothetical protein Hanom_Chr00s000003g01602451 [Helianthus anomalus]